MDKIAKAKDIAAFMIRHYCKKHHGRSDICGGCRALIEYAHGRLDCCPFGEKKPSCTKCSVHCYSKEKRAEIRKVMAYVGPRMIYLMPIEYFKHKKR